MYDVSDIKEDIIIFPWLLTSDSYLESVKEQPKFWE